MNKWYDKTHGPCYLFLYCFCFQWCGIKNRKLNALMMGMCQLLVLYFLEFIRYSSKRKTPSKKFFHPNFQQSKYESANHWFSLYMWVFKYILYSEMNITPNNRRCNILVIHWSERYLDALNCTIEMSKNIIRCYVNWIDVWLWWVDDYLCLVFYFSFIFHEPGRVV